MDCSAVKPRMEALVNGSLPAPDRALAEQHISVCEGCRLELELVRAIGSQEQSPGSAPPPDWTLDRIFGPETAQSQGQPSTPSIPALSPGGIPAPTVTGASSGAQPTSWESASNPFADTPPPDPSPPSAPAPEPAAAKTSSNSQGGEAKAAAPESWDFEPADAKGGMKPPEQSLFFAEEALTRRNSPDNKKASNFRVILWGAGGVIGAVVLALSSWFVLHMAPQTGDDSMPGAAAPETSSPVTTGETEGSAPADPGTVTTAPALPPTPAPEQDGGAASHRPPVSASSAGQPPPLPDAGRTSGAATKHSAPLGAGQSSQPVQSGQPVQPGSHQSQPPAASKPAAISQRPSDTAGRRSAPEASKPTAPAVKPSPEVVADETAAMDPSDTMPGDAHGSGMDGAEPQQAVPVPGAPRYRTRTGTVIAPPPSHTAETTEPPASGKPSSEKPPPEISSPIERIHLATLAAAKQEDLVALRRLRATWKSFMSKMGVGPDRARARREYADCLWAIQSLTARRGDQKDALAAYREYLLSAPAGGADSQSVSRLRQLEDALAEHH